MRARPAPEGGEGVGVPAVFFAAGNDNDRDKEY
jgi:hypothetical protein